MVDDSVISWLVLIIAMIAVVIKFFTNGKEKKVEQMLYDIDWVDE